MPEQASENTIQQLENQVVVLVGSVDSVGGIKTKKYLTEGNEFVYLTRCNVNTPTIPTVKFQVFHRVEGGVLEIDYNLFADHRFERTENPMVFGAAKETAADAQVVTEEDAQKLLQLITGLSPDLERL